MEGEGLNNQRKASMSEVSSYQSCEVGNESGIDSKDEGNIEIKKGGVFDTKTKKLTIFCISLYWFIICCAYSMIAPFFPGEVMFFIFSV